jgi:hypothetical protein
MQLACCFMCKARTHEISFLFIFFSFKVLNFNFIFSIFCVKYFVLIFYIIILFASFNTAIYPLSVEMETEMQNKIAKMIILILALDVIGQ